MLAFLIYLEILCFLPLIKNRGLKKLIRNSGHVKTINTELLFKFTWMGHLSGKSDSDIFRYSPWPGHISKIPTGERESGLLCLGG